MNLGTIIGFIFIFIGLLGGIINYLMERKEWNSGFCKCGGIWELFDVDSQGGRGYNCPKCNSYIWISWLREKQIKG